MTTTQEFEFKQTVSGRKLFSTGVATDITPVVTEPNDINFTGKVVIDESPLCLKSARFMEALATTAQILDGSANYTELKMPDTVAANTSLTLPTSLGAATSVLTDTLGDGVLSLQLNPGGFVRGGPFTTDNSMTRVDLVAGTEHIQQSNWVLDDLGDITRSGLNYIHTKGGLDNQSLGLKALDVITTGQRNTAIGGLSLAATTTQDDNTAVGFESLLVNTASENTAVGSSSLSSNVTGTKNTAVGFETLRDFSAAVGTNTAVGHQALAGCTVGISNTAVGNSCMTGVVTGDLNTAMGNTSLASLTSGFFNCTYGNSSAALTNTGGSNCVFGNEALFFNTTGDFNVAIGRDSLKNVATGDSNIAIGTSAGSSLTLTDSDNICIANTGTVGDNATIRIGTSGTHTSTFIQGAASELASSKPMVINSSTGQIGFSNGVELQTGIISGGILSIDVDTTEFSITDGEGHIYNSATQVLTHVSWTGLTAQSTTYVGVETFVSINSSGVPVYATSMPSNADKRDNIFIGVLVHLDSINLFLVTTQPDPIYNTGLQIQDLMRGLGILNVSGNTISAPAANLTIAKASGELMDHSTNYATDIDDPHINQLAALDTNVADTFAYVYQDLSNSQGNTVLLPNEYDDGNGQGSPGTVGMNNWTTQRVAIGAANQLQVLPGQFVYGTACAAIDNIDTEGFVTSTALTDELAIIGFIIVRGGATDLTDQKDALILQAGKFGGQAVGAIASAQGNDTEIQFNNAGMLDGDPLLLWNAATSDMTVNTLVIDSVGDITRSTATYIHEPNSTSFGCGSGNLNALTTGARNTAVGQNALNDIVTATDSTALGYNTLAVCTVAGNTAVGATALESCTTGIDNSAFGCDSLRAATIGQGNSAFGIKTLDVLTDGGFNSAFGRNALGSLITADNNVAIGTNSLILCTASSNTAIGTFSGDSVTLGTQNTLVGLSAGASLATGSDNICIGHQGGFSLTLADSDNIIIGNSGTVGDGTTIRIGTFATHTSTFLAGVGGVTPAGTPEMVTMDETTGEMGTSGKLVADYVQNLGVSTDNAIARYDLATGKKIQNSGLILDNDNDLLKGAVTWLHNKGGTNNTALGLTALDSVTTGLGNTMVGTGTGTAITIADTNTALGAACLDVLISGDNNVALGSNALDNISTGSDNIGIGFSAGTSLTSADSDNVCISNTGQAGDGGFIRMGNSTDHSDTFHVGVEWSVQGAETDLGDTAPTLTTAQLKTYILKGNPTVDRTWTTPAVITLITTDLNNPQVNDSFDFCVINQNVTNTIDLEGPGTEIGSMDILPSTSGLFRLRLTNVTGASEAYSVYRIS